jgi:hypothetical protein
LAFPWSTDFINNTKLAFDDDKAILQTQSIRQLNQGQKIYENKNDIQYSVDNKTINTSAEDLYEYVDPTLSFTTCINNIDGIGSIKYHIIDGNFIDYPHL